MRLLLIEDTPGLGQAVREHLAEDGHAVDWVQRLDQARIAVRATSYDLVLLDLTLPDGGGLDLLHQWRAGGTSTPVIILTARDQITDRIAGLNAGADDYLAKPFDLEELEARIHALLRRKGGAEASRQKCGQLCFERSSGAFYHDDAPLEFTPREQALLKALMARPGHAVKRERLLQLVFPEDANVQVEAIEVVIHRLRKKLVATQTEIMTLRGLGYLLRAASARSA